MPIAANPEWQTLALYAVGAAALFLVLTRIPYVGRAINVAVSFALVAFGVFLLLQRAPYEPALAGLAARLGLDDQQVAGSEVRLRMARDGHFWARVRLNGIERPMLVDSGATVTALSEATAAAAGVERDAGLVPVMLRTANGMARADTGSVERLELGSIRARHLNVVVSPALGDIDVLGMNFLSSLESWRVEGRALILVPKTAAAAPPR